MKPLNILIMARLRVRSVLGECDKKGNVYFRVSYVRDDNSRTYCYFKHMSSVLDFIDSNFKDMDV